MRSAASVVRPQLQPGVELRVEAPEVASHVMTDGLMLMQVLLNLMQNAARFTKQGFVCVRCTVQQAPGGGLTARFAVLDSGSGISEAAKASLFTLYNSVGGIGLGMFLSGKLLSLLGSKIEVESPWRSEGPGAALLLQHQDGGGRAVLYRGGQPCAGRGRVASTPASPPQPPPPPPLGQPSLPGTLTAALRPRRRCA